MTGAAAREREQVYGALAALLARPPDAASIAALAGDFALDGADGAGGPVAEDLATPIDLEEVACDFTELFRGLRSGGPRPPYESLYREGRLYGGCTDDVEERYRAFGLQPSGALRNEPPDHIALELDFMRHLCALEGRAADGRELRRLLEAQRGFIAAHLAAWAGDLQREVQRADGSGFYSGLLSFASGWLSEDSARLDERLSGMGAGP